MSVLVVGHSQPVPGRRPLHGATGTRLFRLAGRPLLGRELERDGDLAGPAVVLHDYPRPVLVALNFFDVPADDDAERVTILRMTADYFVEVFGESDRLVLLALGRQVADRLGLDHAHYLKMGRAPASLGRLAGACYVPHLSGRNRWWNAPGHLEKGARFLRTLFKDYAPREREKEEEPCRT